MVRNRDLVATKVTTRHAKVYVTLLIVSIEYGIESEIPVAVSPSFFAFLSRIVVLQIHVIVSSSR